MAAVPGHHVNNSTAAALLLAEKERLVSSIAGLFPAAGSVHAATIAAVRDFLIHFRGDAGIIPWVRIYDAFPAWQQQSGLLDDQEWDMDAVLERAMVIFTLINPAGPGIISRKALGGGTWKSTGAVKIGRDVVLTKLYCKRANYNMPCRARDDGFTGFEFHLTMNHQPQFAICVLYPTDYRHCVRDLRQYIHQTSYGHPSNHSYREAPLPAPFDVISELLLSENNSMPEPVRLFIVLIS
ncbi:uncharacterized protein LOC119294399 [Triticum dicoccoides]|uniref:uncharacterized protein LOC119294399 n=1 Tax=Triticum dicoccoides TaxID=85692 RepID=UPI00188F83B5|nr:uncharacterized protein LOC119294399 [Triticum dicoccoides]